MYKITHNSIDIDPNQYFTTSSRRTRSSRHPYRYTQISATKNYYAYSYFPRSIVQWNRLPPNIFPSPSLAVFKDGPEWSALVLDAEGNSRPDRVRVLAPGADGGH